VGILLRIHFACTVTQTNEAVLHKKRLMSLKPMFELSLIAHTL